MAEKSFPLSKVYCLLEPRPVVMVTTADKACFFRGTKCTNNLDEVLSHILKRNA